MAFLRVLRALLKAAGAVAFLAVHALALQDSGTKTDHLAVTAVRHWSLGETTRIAIEVSGEFEYRQDRLSNPERIYFDIRGAKSLVGNQRIHTVTVGDGLLKQIRVSETQPEVTRVVLDLEVPADFSAAQLANPDRLVVELRRKGAPAREGPKPAVPAPPEAPKIKPPAAAAGTPPPVAPAKAEPKLAASKPSQEGVPSPAKRNNTGTRSLVRALDLKLERVVLDPGHGGSDTGTIGPAGLTEKDLVLDVARRLGALIEERLGAEVIYTRSDDVFVPLEERTALANQKRADLFLSLHANSGVATVDGSETYYLNFTTSKSAMDVAARENASSKRSIHELQDLIEKIALKDKVDESREFAVRVQAALYKELARVNSASRDRGVRRAPFAVLIGASMPSVLTEIAFLSNPREERLLTRLDYRQKIAEAIYQGVAQYASTLSRFQVPESKAP
jgi:N-acetylmuramoyl-L-alanine amidase